ncbi:hypothetical protein [Neorhizobium galegae]|uniref:ApeA N-terminal domain 1-containing protein n=1 Tax=Neorhizobium galegae TaxID=399 RepID=UPI00349F04A4
MLTTNSSSLASERNLRGSNRAVTLERCFYRKRSYGFGGVIKSEVEASWAILGVAFDLDEEIRFDEQYASIQGFDEWLRVSGLSLSIIECWFPRRTEPVRRIISIEN